MKKLRVRLEKKSYVRMAGRLRKKEEPSAAPPLGCFWLCVGSVGIRLMKAALIYRHELLTEVGMGNGDEGLRPLA